jgi:hypothetical protein
MKPTEITIKISLGPGWEVTSEGQATISAGGVPEPLSLEMLTGAGVEVSEVPTPFGELGAVSELAEGKIPTPLMKDELAAIAADDLGVPVPTGIPTLLEGEVPEPFTAGEFEGIPVPTDEPDAAAGIDLLEEPSPLAGEAAIRMHMEEGEVTEPPPEPEPQEG